MNEVIVTEEIYRRTKSMKDGRTVMERFIDQFWLVNVTREEDDAQREFTIKEIDDIVHKLIHSLFLKAEDEKVHVYKVHLQDSMTYH